jgi:hypothetical protein
MANVTITNLTSGTALIGTELFEAVQTGTSVKLTADQIKTFVRDVSYGSFYDTTDQTASVNTETLVKFNTTDLTNDITVVNDGSGNPTRITFAVAGVYDVSVNLQLANSAGADYAARIWWKKNGNNVTASGSTVSVPKVADGGVTVFEINLLLNLAAGDYVQVAWATPNVALTLDYTAAITSPYTSPSIPSAIFIATQLS